MMKTMVERTKGGPAVDTSVLDDVIRSTELFLQRDAEARALCEEDGHVLPPYGGRINGHPIEVRTRCMRCYEPVTYTINPDDTQRIKVLRTADGSIADIAYR